MQDGNQDTVSVAEAAAILGVTPDAIRKRLARGTLQGIKHDREWRVLIPDEADTGVSGGVSTQKAASDSALATALVELAAENARNAAAAAMWQERARNLETQLLALQPGDAPENEAVESPVSVGNETTGINTHAEPEHTARGGWSRFLAWLRGE